MLYEITNRCQVGQSTTVGLCHRATFAQWRAVFFTALPTPALRRLPFLSQMYGQLESAFSWSHLLLWPPSPTQYSWVACVHQHFTQLQSVIGFTSIFPFYDHWINLVSGLDALCEMSEAGCALCAESKIDGGWSSASEVLGIGLHYAATAAVTPADDRGLLGTWCFTQTAYCDALLLSTFLETLAH